MNDRERQHVRVAGLNGFQVVNERAHRFARGGEDVDHPAVEDRHDRRDAAFQGIDGNPPEILGTVDEIGVRKLLEGDEEVDGGHALGRQMAVWVDFRAEQGVGSDDLADACQQIAFRVEIAIGHHGAVQAHDDGIDWHGGAELVEDLVAQALIGLPVDEAGRIGPGCRPLDQRPALGGADLAALRDRRGA